MLRSLTTFSAYALPDRAERDVREVIRTALHAAGLHVLADGHTCVVLAQRRDPDDYPEQVRVTALVDVAGPVLAQALWGIANEEAAWGTVDGWGPCYDPDTGGAYGTDGQADGQLRRERGSAAGKVMTS